MPASFYRNTWILLGVVLLGIIYLARYTNIDLQLADYYFNFQTHQFPLKENWWTRDFFHHWLKLALILLGGSFILLCMWDAISPVSNINDHARLRLRMVAIAAIFVPLSISLLKHESALHCPWDIQRYGGDAPYLRWLDAIPAAWHDGQCFPSGHAGSALWLAALAAFWLPSKPWKAAAAFTLGTSSGILLGWVQQMRGAHFLSHTLMSAWLASVIILIILQIGLEM